MFGRIYAWKADNKDLFTVLQKFFTRKPYRHNSWGVGDIYADRKDFTEWQLEAFLCVTTTPITAKDCRVFSINCRAETLEAVTVMLAKMYSGRVYGFLSLLNFVGRWAIELFGGDGRGFCPVRFGDVCSALIYAGLQQIALTEGWTDLTQELVRYHRNCYNSGDTVDVCLKFPTYFTEEI